MADIPPDLTGSIGDTASTRRLGEGVEATKDLTEEILSQWKNCSYYISTLLELIWTKLCQLCHNSTYYILNKFYQACLNPNHVLIYFWEF